MNLKKVLVTSCLTLMILINCTACFKHIDKNQKQVGWSLEDSNIVINDVTLKKVDDNIKEVADDKILFSSIIPSKAINDCKKIKVRQNGNNQLSLEIIKDKIYVKDNVSIDYVSKVMNNFIINQSLPDLKDYYLRKSIIDSKAYIKLSKLLLKNQKAVNELSSCFNNPLSYYQKHKDTLQDYFYDDKNLNPEEIAWMALIDKLASESKLAIFDEDSENIDIVYWLNKINPNKKLKLSENQVTGESVEDSFKMINKEWKNKGYSLVYLYVNSDSYYLMILDNDTLLKVSKLAKINNQKIEKI